MKKITIIIALFSALLLFSFGEPKKKVLIIGDSISIGYTPFVKAALADEADVTHNAGNAQHTGTGLKNIDKWIGNTRWDVIHFNWGLWDLAYRNPQSNADGKKDKMNGKITYTVEEYASNLETLVKKLKSTGARLIFATTTIVPPGEPGRFEDDVKKYNDAAIKIMEKYGVVVNDLTKASALVHKKFGKAPADVHYTEEGYKQLAVYVSAAIQQALNGKIISLQNDLTIYGKQAWEESATPIRPGVPGLAPFWNIRAKQFIYAPAFDYKQVDGAVKYIYILNPSKGRQLTFESAVPFSPLSPVWPQVPVGEFGLKVEGADANGEILGVAGEGNYYRAAPFNGIYHNAVMPYDKSAITTLDTLYSKPHVTSWLKTREPDFNYLNYRYPSKTFSALIVGAVTRAKLSPGTQKAKEAIELAKTIADYQLRISLKQGTPWESFAPTYYGPKIAAAKKEHIAVDRLFTLMGVDAGNAYLDLYDVTKDKKYYDAAIRIADTYKKNQLPEGSWYQFVIHETGQPSAKNILIPTGVVNFLDRLKKSYGVNTYEEVSKKALQWVMDNPVKTFNWQGQFEDISARDPYLNLSREQACELAMYLFNNKTNIALAEELVRFAEDQFVIWEQPLPTPKAKPNAGSNSSTWITPVVQEQYAYFMPVGRTAGIMLDTYSKAYQATKKEIYLAKAKSIANTFTVVQKQHNGYYATYFSTAKLNDWLNSSIYPAKVMMEFNDILKNNKK